MKIKLDIELELPEGQFGEFSDTEVIQAIVDNYTHYATMMHLENASDWLAKSNKDKDIGAAIISSEHKMWANICKNAIIKISRLMH